MRRSRTKRLKTSEDQRRESEVRGANGRPRGKWHGCSGVHILGIEKSKVMSVGIWRIDKKSCWETAHRLTHNSVRDVIQRIYRGKVVQMRGVVLQMMRMDRKGRPRLCIWSNASKARNGEEHRKETSRNVGGNNLVIGANVNTSPSTITSDVSLGKR